MAKNKSKIIPATPAETKTDSKKYVGARYIGPDKLQFQWGILTKGEIYDKINQDIVSKNQDLFEAVFE